MRISSNFSLNTYMRESNTKISNCPHCNCTEFIKHGKYFGLQRYKCKNSMCYKTFSQKTLTAWAYSKKEFEIWQNYIHLMFTGATIRQCAYDLNINIATSFYWRRKILATEIMKNQCNSLYNHVQIHKYIIKENLKGQRNITTEERYNINVVSAIDSDENTLSMPVCKSTLSINILKTKIYAKIDKNAYVSTMGDRILKVVSSKHNEGKIKKNEYNSELVYTFSKTTKGWLVKFRGVATKYLKSYLSWFITIYKNTKSNLSVIIDRMLSIRSFMKCNDFSKITAFPGFYY